ncbi:S41 family peptidase [Rhodocaloribacter sp.]
MIVPTVVLTSWMTASAAEDFLIYLDGASHITLMGEPTFGSTGQPLFLDLPGGGSARIVTKRDTYPDGRDFVGYGIRPDIPVAPSVEDIRTGRDAVLERALAFLRSELTNARR